MRNKIEKLLCLAFLFLAFACGENITNPSSGGVVLPNTATHDVYLTGKVLNENSKPIPNVSVHLTKYNLTTKTDENGVYVVSKNRDDSTNINENLKLEFIDNGHIVTYLEVDSLIAVMPDVYLTQRDISGKITECDIDFGRIEVAIIKENDTAFAELGFNNLVNEFSGFVYFVNSKEKEQYFAFINVYDNNGILIGKSKTLEFNTLLGDIRFPEFDPTNVIPVINKMVYDKDIDLGETLILNPPVDDTTNLEFLWKIKKENLVIDSLNTTVFSYKFDEEANYEIELFVSDVYGNKVSDVFELVVKNIAGTLLGLYGNTISVFDTISYKIEYTDFTKLKTVFVDFGDGNSQVYDSLTDIKHAYGDEFTNDSVIYNLKMSIIDIANDTLKQFAKILVKKDKPKAEISFGYEFPKVGEELKFSAEKSFDKMGKIKQYKWINSQQETNIATEEDFSFTCTDTTRDYSVMLIVIDDDNQADTAVVYPNREGNFVDKRDNQQYKWVKINNQIWMAQNLSYKGEDSNYGIAIGAENSTSAYDYNWGNPKINGITNGYQYTWATALALDSIYDYNIISKYKTDEGIAPSGWKIPTQQEWESLIAFVKENYENSFWTFLSENTKQAIQDFDSSLPTDNLNAFGFNVYLNGQFLSHSANISNSGIRTKFVTATEVDGQNFMGVCLNISADDIKILSTEKKETYSIRCIKE